MNWILTAAACISIMVYGVAVRVTFVKHNGMHANMRLILILGAVFSVLHVYFLSRLPAEPTASSALALVLYATGMAVFVRARASLAGHRLTLAFSRDVPVKLLKSGIYGRIRHPFYLAYTVTWSAGAVAIGTMIVAATAAIMWVIYYRAARLEEDKFMCSDLRDEYLSYRKNTAMFVPFLF
jgi:protein-S-isoprenylcysteine O-methyltransferase Ste14